MIELMRSSTGAGRDRRRLMGGHDGNRPAHHLSLRGQNGNGRPTGTTTLNCQAQSPVRPLDCHDDQGYLPASLRTILAMIPVSRPVTRLGLMMSGAAARCRRAIFMAVGWLSAIASPALRRRNRYRRFSHNETS